MVVDEWEHCDCTLPAAMVPRTDSRTSSEGMASVRNHNVRTSVRSQEPSTSRIILAPPVLPRSEASRYIVVPARTR